MSNYIIKPANLSKKRKLSGMTQGELGNKIGLTLFHVLRVEKGQRGISLRSALRCVDVFGKLDFIDPSNNQVYTIEKKQK